MDARLSALLFFVPMIILYFLTWQNPELVYLVLGDDYSTRELVAMVESGELWTDIAPEERSIASTAILTNNIQVIFLCFAGGITAGVLTTFVLISNGNQIGTLFGLLQANGIAGGLLDFVVAHGFIELSVIVLSGGVGLFMGDGIVRPGLRSRLEVLSERARTRRNAHAWQRAPAGRGRLNRGLHQPQWIALCREVGRGRRNRCSAALVLAACGQTSQATRAATGGG